MPRVPRKGLGWVLPVRKETGEYRKVNKILHLMKNVTEYQSVQK